MVPLMVKQSQLLMENPIVMRVYVPRFFVSSQQRFEAMDIKALCASQLLGLGRTVLRKISVTALFYLEDSRRERERERRAHAHGRESQ